MTREYIMVHHSLTQDSQTVSWAAIERYHRLDKGWEDIGYHAGIEVVADMTIYGIAAYQALFGRPEDHVAAACALGDANHKALHVCIVGNYDIAPPPALMLSRLVDRIILPWMRKYGIGADKIIGHRAFDPSKTCPGSKFDLVQLRELVRAMGG